MDSTELSVSSLSRRVTFDGGGITVVPLLSSGLRLTWREIELVCLTPSMVHEAGEWREKQYTFLTKDFRSTLQTHGLLHVQFVVRDRRPVIARAGSWWNRGWIRGALRPMFDEHDRAMPDQSVLKIEQYQSELNRPLGELLDLLARHCRFDLVVSF